MISSVVTHGSHSKVALAALLELKCTCKLFKQASSHGSQAVKFLVSILATLQNLVHL